MTPKPVIGVDLSYTATGIAWPGAVGADGAWSPVADTFGTVATDGPDHTRAAIIAAHVYAHARDADFVCIEDGVSRSHAAFRSGLLHGIVRDRLAPMWDRVLLVPPATLKKYATGKGNCDKTAMVVAARERLGYDGLDNNEADALWLQALGYELVGRPVVELPKTHLSALDGLRGAS